MYRERDTITAIGSLVRSFAPSNRQKHHGAYNPLEGLRLNLANPHYLLCLRRDCEQLEML